MYQSRSFEITTILKVCNVGIGGIGGILKPWATQDAHIYNI